MLKISWARNVFRRKNEDNLIGCLLKKDPYNELNEEFADRIKVLLRAYNEEPVVLYAPDMLNGENNQDTIMPFLNNLDKKYPCKDADVKQEKP